MNNQDFWHSIFAIIDEGFTAEGLSKLEPYAEQFITQRLVYKRFSPAEQYGNAAGGTTHVIATLLAGAETAADSDAAPDVGDFKRGLQRGAKQAERINKTMSMIFDRNEKKQVVALLCAAKVAFLPTSVRIFSSFLVYRIFSLFLHPLFRRCRRDSLAALV